MGPSGLKQDAAEIAAFRIIRLFDEQRLSVYKVQSIGWTLPESPANIRCRNSPIKEFSPGSLQSLFNFAYRCAERAAFRLHVAKRLKHEFGVSAREANINQTG